MDDLPDVGFVGWSGINYHAFELRCVVWSLTHETYTLELCFGCVICKIAKVTRPLPGEPENHLVLKTFGSFRENDTNVHRMMLLE